MYRRVIYLILISVFTILTSVCSADESPSLPEIEGWKCGELRTTQLDSVSGDQGYWQERDYRTGKGTPIKATLLYGAGPKFFNQPPKGVSSGEGPDGLGASYEIISIAGFKSSMEKDPALGYSVAVNAFDRKFSLTIECGVFEDRGEVIRCAEILLGAIK
jgi:hypothetical protein